MKLWLLIVLLTHGGADATRPSVFVYGAYDTAKACADALRRDVGPAVPADALRGCAAASLARGWAKR